MIQPDDTPTVSRRFGLLTAFGTLPLALLVGYFGGLDRGGTGWGFAAAIVLAGKFRWKMKDHSWFWIAVVGLVILHLPIVIFAPWPYSGAAFLPVAFLDFAIDVGVLTLLGKAMEEKYRKGSP